MRGIFINVLIGGCVVVGSTCAVVIVEGGARERRKHGCSCELAGAGRLVESGGNVLTHLRLPWGVGKLTAVVAHVKQINCSIGG
jgi:hypothetical protein